jgi:hypothetical protein
MKSKKERTKWQARKKDKNVKKQNERTKCKAARIESFLNQSSRVGC